MIENFTLVTTLALTAHSWWINFGLWSSFFIPKTSHLNKGVCVIPPRPGSLFFLFYTEPFAENDENAIFSHLQQVSSHLFHHLEKKN